MKKSLVVLAAVFFLSALLLAEGPNSLLFVNLANKGWSDDFSAGHLSNRWMASTGGLGFSPKNVDLSQFLLGLRLTQTKGADGKFSSMGAEIQSQKMYGFGTYTWLMRASSTAITPTGAGESKSGSSSGVFSFLDDSDVEIDFEVEGAKQETVWMCNWFGVKKWDVQGTKLRADVAFHEYKYVWSASQVEWFVDGKSVAVVRDNVPQKPAYVLINHWGTNNLHWGGLATEGTRTMWVKRFSFVPSQ